MLAFEVWHKSCPEYTRTVYARSASAARYDRYLDLQEVAPDLSYLDMRSRKIGAAQRHEICDPCDKGYRADRHPDPTAAHKICQEWNAKYPVGTRVIYEEVIGLTGPFETETRSEAWVLGSHTPVVMIEGVAGGCSLDHMKVLA